ncbi:MAG: hypothetical protein HUJ63_08305, partial [Enterococcus sp.]|nr:hypothetical protein [Enterococcus sp.]
MKKHFLIATGLLLLSSCSDEGKFVEYAKQFSFAINSNDTVAFSSMIAEADSFQWNLVTLGKINIDSLKAEKTDGGKYLFTTTDSIDFIVAKLADDKMQVESTHGVFCSEKASIEFAQKVNLVKPDDSDFQIFKAVHSEQYAIAKQ